MDEKRLEQLEKELVDLRKDFHEISRTLKELADSKEETFDLRARRRYHQAREKAQDVWQEFRGQGGKRACAWCSCLLREIKGKVRDHPWLAVVIIAVVGFLIGRWF